MAASAPLNPPVDPPPYAETGELDRFLAILRMGQDERLREIEARDRATPWFVKRIELMVANWMFG